VTAQKNILPRKRSGFESLNDFIQSASDEGLIDGMADDEIKEPPRKKRRISAVPVESITDKQKPIGDDIVGLYIEILWPLDNHYYGGRVLRYDVLEGLHVVCYDFGVDSNIEHLNLNDGSRVWRRALEDPYEEYSLVGRMVMIDWDEENDSEEEARLKLAYVLAVVQTRGTGYGRFSRSSCSAREKVLHKVVWVHGETLDNVDFLVHSYSILRH